MGAHFLTRLSNLQVAKVGFPLELPSAFGKIDNVERVSHCSCVLALPLPICRGWQTNAGLSYLLVLLKIAPCQQMRGFFHWILVKLPLKGAERVGENSYHFSPIGPSTVRLGTFNARNFSKPARGICLGRN